MVVTPWEVSGEVDYGELIERFGTRPLTQDLLGRIGRHQRRREEVRGVVARMLS